MWAQAYGLIQYFVWIATANYSIITWTKLVRLGLLGCVHCSIQAYWWSTATTAFPLISLLISSLKCDVVVAEWQSLLYVCRLMNSNFGLQIYSLWTKQTNLINQYLSCVNRHLTMLRGPFICYTNISVEIFRAHRCMDVQWMESK